MLLLGLGVIVVQAIRHRLVALYPALIVARILFCAVCLVLYLYSHDPLFLAILAVVALGLALTATAYLLERGTKA